MDLVYYPNPKLQIPSKEIKKFGTDELKETVRQMFETLYQTSGIGLAGPQVAFMNRLFVVNMTCDPSQKDKEEVYINPVITKKSGKERGVEACLSFPGVVVDIERAHKVKVKYYDINGDEKELEAEDLYARVFQHEIDHLDGILILDRMSKAEKQRWSVVFKRLVTDYKLNRKPKRVKVTASI